MSRTYLEIEIRTRLFEVSFERETTFSEESAYDADGRLADRYAAVETDRFEDLEVEEILEDDEVFIEEWKDPVLWKEIEFEVSKWMEQNVPQFQR